MTVTAESANVDRTVPAGRRLSLQEGIRSWIDNVRSGEIGSLPVVLALIVIAIIFQAQNNKFLSAQNLTNLIVQMAPVAVISLGIVFVLLIGEIDLSVGVVSGVGGIIIARLLLPDGNELPWYLAILIAAIVALAIGALHGFFVAKLGVPSLIVTLATLYIGTGVVLALAGQQGLIRVQDDTVIDIANTFLADGIGWGLAAAAVVIFAISPVRGGSRQSQPGAHRTILGRLWRKGDHRRGLLPSLPWRSLTTTVGFP